MRVTCNCTTINSIIYLSVARKALVGDINDKVSQLDHMLTWKVGQGRGIVISQMAILTNYEICQQL